MRLGINGNVISGGGDIAGVIYKEGINIDELANALKKVFPKNDPRPEQFRNSLEQLQKFHQTLFEWKELHNALDEIITSFDQFSSEIHRYSLINKMPLKSTLRDLWYPVSDKVEILLEFAKNIDLIGKRYSDDNGDLAGERWAVKISDLHSHINLQLDLNEASSFSTRSPNLGNTMNYLWGRKPDWWITLYELNNEFNHVANSQMHFADRKLRETANKLYTLSQSIFGSEQ